MHTQQQKPTLQTKLLVEKQANAAGGATLQPGASAVQSRLPTWAAAMPLQAKLTVNQPGDVYEQEADRVAEQVMRMPAPTVQRASAGDKTGTSTPPVRRPPFDDQPAELRSVLEASFAAGKFGCRNGADAASCFNLLDSRSRLVLTSLYNRLSRFKLWNHVVYVSGLWTSGAGGAQFIVQDHLSFFKSSLDSAQFCVDTAAGGMLHKGTTSLREISTGDSLHLSIASGNSVSAHIDAISPVAGRETGGQRSYDPVRSMAHIGREAIPDMLKTPNLQIFPEPRRPSGLPGRDELPPDIIRFEITF